MRLMQKNWDIFCRVIDNFGDAGVCWRLSRQLAAEYGHRIRLWIDDLAPLEKICPRIDTDQHQQTVDGVFICLWLENFSETLVADVVIEAFACELPPSYMAAMQRRFAPPCWINLEYLTAENWIDACHGLPSPHPQLGLKKYFFFPGFSPGSGGLLRECGLFEMRDHFLKRKQTAEKPFGVSLFCYHNANLGPFLRAWAESSLPIHCKVAEGKSWQALQSKQQQSTPLPGGHDKLTVEAFPFLPQPSYDQLLWESDLNIVRGEDSFVRAQWAAKPFLWHIYPQSDSAHLIKLEAFLERYTEGLPAPQAALLQRLHFALNTAAAMNIDDWLHFMDSWPVYAAHAADWCRHLTGDPCCQTVFLRPVAQGNLTANLVSFVENIYN